MQGTLVIDGTTANGIIDCFWNGSDSRLVEHPVGILRATVDGVEIANIPFNDFQARILGKIAFVAGREIIQDGDFVPVCE